ncbi:methyltransferase family protein [Halovivax ruber XH-70]|uniref:Methyltransferase family protein n=1 Tax=Halovivax ruber (strain DSM 18193 / JCM 13892 / XH-70) TaxID=797302 RepID=L0IA55_HALRX|nr:methyltransferase domain-containing protein [Halovivax ruber]AGB15614.1 methyltransferase family protein [Halovivax ruber XH-70]
MAAETAPTVLDVGCGANKRDPGAIGLDLRAYADVDVVADLDSATGLPFEANRFDEVLAYSVLEHVRDLPQTMAELHRIATPGGTIRGKVPHWRDRNAYVDPTHEQLFDERTFDFWDPTTEHGAMEYFDVEFRVRRARRIRRVQFWKSRPIAFELEVVK